jgi:hypothetical protein
VLAPGSGDGFEFDVGRGAAFRLVTIFDGLQLGLIQRGTTVTRQVQQASWVQSGEGDHFRSARRLSRMGKDRFDFAQRLALDDCVGEQSADQLVDSAMASASIRQTGARKERPARYNRRRLNPKNIDSDVQYDSPKRRHHIERIRGPHEKLVVPKTQDFGHQTVSAEGHKYSERQSHRPDEGVKGRDAIGTLIQLGREAGKNTDHKRAYHG